jgi:CBF1 interacting corepressor
MGDEKARLGLSFMYNAPGTLKDQEAAKKNNGGNNNADDEMMKFEWRKNAPREEWAKNDANINDQPFAIEVRNVKCLKCKRWGHVNTDKVCPMYGKSRLDCDMEISTHIDGKKLAEDMKSQQGLEIKSSLVNKSSVNIMEKDSEEEEEEAEDEKEADGSVTLDMLRALEKKEKKILLKRLLRLHKKMRK